jgi:4-amino-4-deoxy-L-arabinose transferase-like glycosyltransferase
MAIKKSWHWIGVLIPPKEISQVGNKWKHISSTLVGHLLLFGIVLFVCFITYKYILAPREIFHWDEASYANRALTLFIDLKQYDIGTFLKRCTTSDFLTYGFFHAYIESFFFSTFGVSYISARSLSLFLFFLSLILIYLISIRVVSGNGWVVGILAVLFTVTSPEMLNWFTSNMLEPLSVFMALLSMFFFLLAIEKQRPVYYYTTGVVVGLNFLTKHNYGVILILSFLCIGLWDLGETVIRGSWLRLRVYLNRYLLLFLGSALIITVWLAQTNIDVVLSRFKWEISDQFVSMEISKLPFTTKVLGYTSAITGRYTFSKFLGYYFLLAVIASLWFVRDVRIRAILFFVFISWILTATNDLLQARYIITFVPFVFILAAFLPVYLLRSSRNASLSKWAILLTFIVYSVLVLRDVTTLKAQVKAAVLPVTNYVMKPPYSKIERSNLKDVLDFFRQVIPVDRSFSTVVRSGFLSPYVWRFHFHDWKVSHFSSNEIDDPKFLQVDYFITIEIDNNFPYLDDIKSENRMTNLGLWNSYLQRRLESGSVKVHDVKNFPDLHVQAIIYENLLKGTTLVPPPLLPKFLPPMKL